jgi:hypothetical protein
MQCPSMKSPPICYGSEFILKRRHYYAFIVKQMQKIYFLNEISF